MATTTSSSAKLLNTLGKASHELDRLFKTLEADASNTANERARSIQQKQTEIETLRKSTESNLALTKTTLKADKLAFETEKQRMVKLIEAQQDKVTLDVGGNRFCTAMSTLKAFKGSRFESLFDGEIEADEDDGSYFIDRDGRFFHLLLKYLRDPSGFSMPTDPMQKKELIKEAQYFKVDLPKKATPTSTSTSTPTTTTPPAPAPTQTQTQPIAVAPTQISTATPTTTTTPMNATVDRDPVDQTLGVSRSNDSGRYYRESVYGDDGGGDPNDAAYTSDHYYSDNRDTTARTPSENFGGRGMPNNYDAVFQEKSGNPPLRPVPEAQPSSNPPASQLFQPQQHATTTSNPAQFFTPQPQPSSNNAGAPPPRNYGGAPPPTTQQAYDMYNNNSNNNSNTQQQPPQHQQQHMGQQHHQHQQPPRGMQPPPTASNVTMMTPSHTTGAPPVHTAPPPTTNEPQWGNAPAQMTINPITQREHNTTRGWNDVPSNTGAKKAPTHRVPIAAPITNAISTPMQPAQVNTQQQPIQTAPAPVVAVPKPQLQLTGSAKEMADIFSALMDKCKAGANTITTNKVSGIDTKLQDLYEKIYYGGVSEHVINDMKTFATTLYQGNHVGALGVHKQIIQVHGTTETPAVALKQLVSLVKSKVDKQQW